MRFENWPTILNELIESRRNIPFQWGSNDCAIFSGDVVKAMTGIDYVEPYRGRYTTTMGSVRVLAKAGHANIEQAVTAALGPPVKPGLLKRGDVALFDTGNGETVGICVGPQVVAPAAGGLEWVPLAFCLRGWCV